MASSSSSFHGRKSMRCSYKSSQWHHLSTAQTACSAAIKSSQWHHRHHLFTAEKARSAARTAHSGIRKPLVKVGRSAAPQSGRQTQGKEQLSERKCKSYLASMKVSETQHKLLRKICGFGVRQSPALLLIYLLQNCTRAVFKHKTVPLLCLEMGEKLHNVAVGDWFQDRNFAVGSLFNLQPLFLPH